MKAKSDSGPAHATRREQAEGAPGPPGDGRPSDGGPTSGRLDNGGHAVSAVAEGLVGAEGRLIGGRYRLVAAIGNGSMGTVWRARDELLDRAVAVKEVRFPVGLSAAERDDLCQRTLREARTAARLSHPAVAAVYDVVGEQGRPWIIMELVYGRPLDRVIKTSGPLSPKGAAEIGQQLLAALATAHSAGVLHRDVKPGNVLLTGDRGAVLTDFGIATFDGDPSLTQAGMVIGTPAFMAPERVAGEIATPAADLWSLGATLYAAVEGRGPYDHHRSISATMAAIVTTDPAWPRTAGPLTEPIAALLTRDPAARPSAAAAMGMLEVAAGAAAGTRSHRFRPSRPPQRARWVALVVAAVACLVIAVPVSIWALHRTTDRTTAPRSVSRPTAGSDPGKSTKPLHRTPRPGHRKPHHATHRTKPHVPPKHGRSSPQSTPPPSSVSVTSPGDQASTVGTAVKLHVPATNKPAGQALAYRATGLPRGLSINSATGLISGTLTTVGTSKVTVTVTDSANASASVKFTWQISVTATITGVGGQCIDDSSSVTSDGNKIQVFDCDQTPAQIWTLAANGTMQVLGKCMTVNNGGTAAGSLIVLWDCTGARSQIWHQQANGELVNPASSRCLEDPNSGGWQTQLDIANCTDTANQRWTVNG